jgi:hypothetical protein
MVAANEWPRIGRLNAAVGIDFGQSLEQISRHAVKNSSEAST